MKLFVTGATGVLGTPTVRYLVEDGHDVTALARSDAKAARLEGMGAVPAVVDLFDAAALAAVIAGHDAVLNLATSIPPLSRAARPGAWDENDRIRVEGSRNVVDAAIAGGVARVVQESITYLYPDCGDQWIDEAVPPAAVAMLATAVEAEAQNRRFVDAGGVGVVLRYAMFYGAGSSHTEAFLRLARRRIGLVNGPPKGYVSAIHADDAARAAVAALSAPAGVYNVADDEPLTRKAFAGALGEAVGRRPWVYLPGRAARLFGKRGAAMARSQRVSNRAFKQATGWTPQYPSFRDGIAAVLAEGQSGELVDA